MKKIEASRVEQFLKELNVYGYTVIEQFLEPKAVQELLKTVNNLFDPAKHATFSGRPERELGDKFVYGLQKRDLKFIELLGHPVLEEILMNKLNDPYYRHLPATVPNYILSFYNARSSGPKLDLHTDTFVPSPGDKTWTMQVVFALEDSTIDNGCSIVVPGSHVSGKFVDRNLAKVEHIEAKAGDVVIWDSRIWHGSTENCSKKSRWALVATLTCWWVKQRCDIPRGLPQSIYEKLNDKQKALLGFCSIPPLDEAERLNFKSGYEVLKPSVKDYF